MPISGPGSPSPIDLAPHRSVTFVHENRDERIVVAISSAAGASLAEQTAEAWLGENELKRIARAVPKRRREFILGRHAAKTALAVWHERASFGDFSIEPGAFEQPVVIGASAADVTLAHASEAAVAIAHERGHPMGVDLEAIDPAQLEVVRTQVSAGELPSPSPRGESDAERYFLLWSAKEALSKALRCGLTCPFELLATTGARFTDRGICTGTFANFGQYQFVAWVAANRTFALACSRRAQLEPVLENLTRFTHEALGGESR